jgi:hypothetical protein
MIQTIHNHSISGFCSDMFPVSKMRWAFLRRWVGQKLLNMLTYVGNDWSGYNIYYIAMKKNRKCSGYRSVCLGWIKQFGKNSPPPDSLGFQNQWFVKHSKLCMVVWGRSFFRRRVEVAVKRPWNSLDIFGQMVPPPEVWSVIFYQ